MWNNIIVSISASKRRCGAPLFQVVCVVPDIFLQRCHCNKNTNRSNFGFNSWFKMSSSIQKTCSNALSNDVCNTYKKRKGIEGRGGSWVITFREWRKNRYNVNIALSPHAAVHSGTRRYSGVALYDQSPIAEHYKPQVYRAIPLIPKGPTQQKSWRPCWCSRQKSLIKIILNWNTNMAAVTSCANALYIPRWCLSYMDK
jgi:hypothetical protein